MKNDSKSKGTLYLLPSALGVEGMEVIPAYVLGKLASVSWFLVESERSARRFLRSIGFKPEFDPNKMIVIGKHKDESEIISCLSPAEMGFDMAMVTDAGMPGIADPGAEIIAMAHQKGISVKPLVGPSSIFLALMASGFNGQQFCFNGYLPINSKERIMAIKKIESKAWTEGSSQIFMETPYRNNQLTRDILSTCRAETMLCIAVDITLPTEYIESKPIKTWKLNPPDFHKRPAIFILAGN